MRHAPRRRRQTQSDRWILVAGLGSLLVVVVVAVIVLAPGDRQRPASLPPAETSGKIRGESESLAGNQTVNGQEAALAEEAPPSEAERTEAPPPPPGESLVDPFNQAPPPWTNLRDPMKLLAHPEINPEKLLLTHDDFDEFKRLVDETLGVRRVAWESLRERVHKYADERAALGLQEPPGLRRGEDGESTTTRVVNGQHITVSVRPSEYPDVADLRANYDRAVSEQRDLLRKFIRDHGR